MANLVFPNLTSFVVKTSGLYVIPVDYNVLLLETDLLLTAISGTIFADCVAR